MTMHDELWKQFDTASVLAQAGRWHEAIPPRPDRRRRSLAHIQRQVVERLRAKALDEFLMHHYPHILRI